MCKSNFSRTFFSIRCYFHIFTFNLLFFYRFSSCPTWTTPATWHTFVSTMDRTCWTTRTGTLRSSSRDEGSQKTMTEEQNNMRTCSLFQEICVNLCTCKLVVHRCKETLQPEELIIMSYFPSIKHGLSLLFFNLVKFLQWGISNEISWEAIRYDYNDI